MRTKWHIVILVLVLLALLIPWTVSAQPPCPDDPELSADCNPEAPPYYVVINRAVEYLYPDRPGTGCQPIILNHPDCTDCVSGDCADIDIETEVCATLPAPSGTETVIVYEMCCNCASDPDGYWWFRIRLLQPDGTCPIDPDNQDWIEGLPPGTGIDLPLPVIVGGLVVLGGGLLALGVLVRRRTVRTA